MALALAAGLRGEEHDTTTGLGGKEAGSQGAHSLSRADVAVCAWAVAKLLLEQFGYSTTIPMPYKVSQVCEFLLITHFLPLYT